MTPASLTADFEAPAGPRSRVTLLGMPVDTVDRARAKAILHAFARSGRHHQIVTVNTDFLAVGRRERAFRDLVGEADLVVPDGAPVVWAARLLGHRLPRITGPDLIAMAVRHSRTHGSSVFFLGGAPGDADRAAQRLQQAEGRFSLAGVAAPDAGVSAVEDARIARRVRDAGPDFIFVGFGCPKQDYWIRNHRDILDSSVCAGVGGSFGYLSGRVRRAPSWAQRAGLEWAFRLKAEPRRLAKRYLIDDLPVVLRLCKEALRP